MRNEGEPELKKVDEQPEPYIIGSIVNFDEGGIQDVLPGRYGTPNEAESFERTARILKVLDVPEAEIEELRRNTIEFHGPGGSFLGNQALRDIISGEDSQTPEA